MSLGPTGPCQAGATTLCLNDGRFEVALEWEASDGSSGPGQAVAMTGDAGYFWFFDRENVEVVVKLLDACGVNDRFWVFAAGLTNVKTTLRVRTRRPRTCAGTRTSGHGLPATPGQRRLRDVRSRQVSLCGPPLRCRCNQHGRRGTAQGTRAWNAQAMPGRARTGLSASTAEP